VAVASRQRAEGDRMVGRGKVEEACLSLYAYYCLFSQPNIKVEILIKKGVKHYLQREYRLHIYCFSLIFELFKKIILYSLWYKI
jgi:hypothetical protein